MPAATPVVLDDFSGGVLTNVARYLQPKKSVYRISNLWMLPRGALSTVYGSSLKSLADSSTDPSMNDLAVYAPTTQQVRLHGTIQHGDPGSGTSVSVSLPTAAVPGDYIVVSMVNANGGTATPTGWTKLLHTNVLVVGGWAIFGHLQAKGDPTTVTFTQSGGGTGIWFWQCAAYSGVNAATPIDASGIQDNLSPSTTATSPSISPVGTSDKLLMLYMQEGTSAFSAPSEGTIEDHIASGNVVASLAFVDASLVVGATGNQTVTLGSSEISHGAQIALLPATGIVLGCQRALVGNNYETAVYNVSLPTALQLGTSTPTNINGLMPTMQMVPFVDFMFITNGNQDVPNYWDGQSLNKMTNGWTASGAIPVWAAATPQNVGDRILPLTPNGFYFKCIQAGTTNGTTEPAWPSAVGKTVTDGTAGTTPVVWKCVAKTTATVPNAAFLFNHAGSLWAWGTYPNANVNGVDGPSTIRMSDVGNGNSWDPSNTSFIGEGDGQTARGGAVFALEEAGIATTPRLILFKDFSTYEVLGVFPAIQDIVQAKTSRGNMASRSAQFIGNLGGVIRFSHEGFALYQGPGEQGDTLISDGIRDYIFGTSDPNDPNPITAVDFTQLDQGRSTVLPTPNTYICALPLVGTNGAVTRLFMFDTILKAWNIVDLAMHINALAFIKQPDATPEIWASNSVASAPPAAEGSVYRILSNASDTTWETDPGGTASFQAITWSLQTPIITPKADTPSWFDSLNIKTRGGTPAITSVVAYYDTVGAGTPTTKTLRPPTSLPGTVSVNVEARGLSLKITGTGPMTLEALELWTEPLLPRRYSRV